MKGISKGKNMKLNKLMVEHVNAPKRVSILTALAFVDWIRTNKPEVYKDCLKALNSKDCKDAFNDLESFAELWR